MLLQAHAQGIAVVVHRMSLTWSGCQVIWRQPKCHRICTSSTLGEWQLVSKQQLPHSHKSLFRGVTLWTNTSSILTCRLSSFKTQRQALTKLGLVLATFQILIYSNGSPRWWRLNMTRWVKPKIMIGETTCVKLSRRLSWLKSEITASQHQKISRRKRKKTI